MDEIQDYYDRKARYAHLAGFATVDELRAAYEQILERSHARADEIQNLREILESAPEPAYRTNHGGGIYPEQPGREPCDPDYDHWYKNDRAEVFK